MSLAQGKLKHLELLEEALQFHPKSPINMVVVRELLGLVVGDLQYLKGLADYNVYKVNYGKKEDFKEYKEDQSKQSILCTMQIEPDSQEMAFLVKIAKGDP